MYHGSNGKRLVRSMIYPSSHNHESEQLYPRNGSCRYFCLSQWRFCCSECLTVDWGEHYRPWWLYRPPPQKKQREPWNVQGVYIIVIVYNGVFFNFHPYLGKISNLTNIFRWVEATTQYIFWFYIIPDVPKEKWSFQIGVAEWSCSFRMAQPNQMESWFATSSWGGSGWQQDEATGQWKLSNVEIGLMTTALLVSSCSLSSWSWALLQCYFVLFFMCIIVVIFIILLSELFTCVFMFMFMCMIPMIIIISIIVFILIINLHHDFLHVFLHLHVHFRHHNRPSTIMNYQCKQHTRLQ